METEPRVTWSEVLAIRDFRTVFLAYAQSRIGDQLARVAVTLLVFGRTHSPALTALTYALTFLPPLLSAPLLSGLADRFPRRTVMVTADLVRAVTVAVMAVPVLPLWSLAVLLVVTSCCDPVFSAARNAVVPAVLPGDRYAVGTGLMTMLNGLSQVVGFMLGGAAVASVPSGYVLDGPHAALAVNACSFVVSAVVLRSGLSLHRPPEGDTTAASGVRTFALAGLRMIGADRRLLALGGLVWLYGFFIAPEAIAAPYSAELGTGAVTVGLLMAADPVGNLAGTFVLTRLVGARRRRRLLVPLAVATGLPLVASAVLARAGGAADGERWLLVPIVLAWALTGALSCYIVVAQSGLVEIVPDATRGRVVGVLSAGLQSAQGVGVLLAGVLAEATSPSTAVGLCGAAGSVVAVLLGSALRRAGATRSRVSVESGHDPTPH